MDSNQNHFVADWQQIITASFAPSNVWNYLIAINVIAQQWNKKAIKKIFNICLPFTLFLNKIKLDSNSENTRKICV